MSVTSEASKEARYNALKLAVILHSASNLAKGAIPPNATTVLKTADIFKGYIERGSK